VLVTAGAVLAGTVMASAAAPALPRQTPARLLANMRHATLPSGMTAVVVQTANLGFPALPDIPGLSSSTLSAASLITGRHTVDIWYAGPQRVRIALPVSFGETDLRVNGHQIWLWDSHKQTATRYILPAPPTTRPPTTRPPTTGPAGTRPETGTTRVPPMAELTPLQAAKRLLAMVGPTTAVTVQGAVTVAGRPAYQLAIAPRTASSLIGQILIAVDAKTYLPLQVQVYPRGSSTPAFQVGFTSLTFGQPAMSNFTFTPPPGAKVKTVRLPSALPAEFSAFGVAGPGIFALPGAAGVFRVPGGPDRVQVRIAKPPCHLAGLHARVAVRPAALREAIITARNNGGGRFNVGAGPRILGSGWLTVVVLPTTPVVSSVTAGSGPRGLAESAAYQSAVSVRLGPPSPVGALLRTLLNAATRVHGSWGSGRLLRTSLFSVLMTSKGDVLIGAVTPSVLYADAAKVK
jgi:outer membrane lipoprotein-sorting protein